MRRGNALLRLTGALLLLLFPAAAFAADGLLPPGPVASYGALAVGQAPPSLMARDIDGKVFSLVDLRGKPVLIDFGSIFCRDCQEIIGELGKLQEQYAGSDLVILAVAAGGTKEEVVRNFFKNRKTSFRVVFDKESALFDRYGITQIPLQVVIGRDGLVRTLHVGKPANIVRDLSLDKVLEQPTRR